MTSNRLSRFVAAVFLLGLLACSGAQTKETDSADKRAYLKQENPVQVMVLKKEPFEKELVNNGKLVAVRKSDLQFQVSEQLIKLAVKNGDHVKAGQLIASLNPFSYQQKLENARIELDKARMDLRSRMMGRGYKTLDTTRIPIALYHTQAIQSGYESALRDLKMAEFNRQATRLIAPFSGIVANINKNQYDQVNAGDTFCTLIDNSEFEVEFSVVENEIKDIEIGEDVQIVPFANSSQAYHGRISEINPVIDEDGLIQVKARVKNPGGLMEGMNVKVLVEKEIPNQLVVPKSAVVLRQNQEVLFKYTKGKAFWTYVKTVAENSNSYSVIAHPDKGGTLAAGDTVIVSGNLNLAHESEVIIK
ncbi:cation efflux system protein [Prolixibacter bellariivorans]|uniref:Cation efflux system protein n=1 Tax=Prolixibacter bellariivorans TaxID=314319 RepID=A0A5M4B5D9_9BACT|nr:efflux RND transporter periplasmic adaptor subunit [Prolixibacter bellariivorans]GET35096.1 cation efflux system protein [Prolixibacter bellariivorans]